MDAKRFIRSLCEDLKFDVTTNAAASKTYELALKKGFDKKHKTMALAAGSLYFYCRSTGKPIILNKILEIAPLEQEEVMAVYNDLKKDILG